MLLLLLLSAALLPAPPALPALPALPRGSSLPLLALLLQWRAQLRLRLRLLL